MLRTFLSTIAFSVLVTVPPCQAGTMQGSDRDPAPAKVESSATINLNTATVKDLETLPGIGAKTAARIIEYRQKNGPFKKIEELMNVQGIGEKSFLKLRVKLTVTTPKPEPVNTTQSR